MTRVIHTGDTHLGYRQYHSPQRRQDFLDAFRRVVDDAVTDDVDAVVHAGDLFHDRRPDLPDLLGVIDVLDVLREAGIPFLAVVGNHEGTRHAQWLDLFESLSLAERLDDEPRVVGDVALYGLDYVPESRRPALDYEFAPHDAAHAALVSHGLFTPFPHADWETETVLDESNDEFDAMLLGDNHAPDRAELRGTWITYCGSTERASADERDGRGYNLVEFDDGVRIARRGIDTRRFVHVDLDLGPEEGTDRVRERLREEDVEDAVVVVTIDGEGGDVAAAEIERFGEERGALLTRVNDRREFDAPETALDVDFADPDEAVRERVRELGLSEAAHAVDETVRASTVADSNVRDRVADRVREFVAEDLDAFVAADAGGADDAG